jgi:hypothetical protein
MWMSIFVFVDYFSVSSDVGSSDRNIYFNHV